MKRRHFLALPGLALLPFPSLGQGATQTTKRDLFLADAPIRTVLELVLTGYGKHNYVVRNNVTGLVTARLVQQGFDETMGFLCQKNTPELFWSNEDRVVRVERRPGTPDSTGALEALFQQARLPQVEGVPCRMAGCLLGEGRSWAILELGSPPESGVMIVELSKQVRVLRDTYLVSKITAKELTLEGAKKTLKIPFAPLVPVKG